jgi:PadR family transcriptional regulator AphA
VYSVTAKGRRALRRWLAEPSAPPQFESEAVLRSVFAEHGTKEDLLATLQSLHDQMMALRRQGAGLIAEYLDGGTFPQRLHVIALTTRFLAEYIVMLRDWAAWAEAEVETWPDTSFLQAAPPEAVERYRAIIGEDLVEEARRILSGTGSEPPPSGPGDDVAQAG